MKKYTIPIGSLVQSFNILVVVLCFGFIRLHAQNSRIDIIPTGSAVTMLKSGSLSFLKGLVWYKDSVMLLVDDGMVGSTPDIFKYNPVTKQISTWQTNATHCTGLSCDRMGNLIGTSSVILMMDGSRQVSKTMASAYNGKTFDNPFDLIADNKGGVYFADLDLFQNAFPQDKTAVYYIDPAGNVTRVIDDLEEPNGLALSPDDSKLYVVDTNNKYVYSWDVASDGSVSNQSSLAELHETPGVPAVPFGMAIDMNGNIYVATAMGIQIFSPQGVFITTIVLPFRPSDCDFGGTDFKTLYITTRTNLYSIDLKYPGYAVSRNGSGGGTIISALNKPLFEIYPNPAKESLHLRLNSGKVSSVDILTLDGKKVSVIQNKADGTNMELNTQNLKSGMYLLRAVTDGGIVTRKFVVGKGN